VLIVPLAKRLGLGSVLGYLLAGIIIGPFLMGFIAEEGEELMHFAEFGVVMMLFLVGLELEPRLLWRLRTPIVGMGGVQVLSTTVIIGAIALSLGFTWQQSLAIGMTFSLSSTAIVLQTLSEKGLLGSAGGRSSFAVLLFQDIAVIPMLALMPLLAFGVSHGAEAHHDGSHGASLLNQFSGPLQGLLTLLAVVVVIAAGRYIAPKIMALVAGTRQRELITGAALLLVISVAVLMTAVGLSPALGTFLGGVVLANSPYKHEIESDLEPFKGLLLGLFFMAVGASIDFKMIAESPGIILGLTGLLLIIKGSLLFVIGKSFKLSLDQNFLFAFGLAQTGEFAFVLLSLIDQQGILPDRMVGLLLVVVALSMAATPLLMLLNDKVLRPWLGTREVVEPQAMDDITARNRVIVAGFGTFGAAVGRFLAANGMQATILDADSDRVDLLRRMGFEVYYGDATRFDLLETAGAMEAEAIIIGLPQPELNISVVETVKKHFPHLHIIVRAFDYEDTYELMDAGVMHIHRESVGNGVNAAVAALRLLGFRAYQLERTANRFLAHDKAALQALAAVRHDEQRYVDMVRERVEETETQLRSDLAPGNYPRDFGWDNSSLTKELKEEA
jgi:CPA2 family monovalent cation:H+ antiporter-2/glutathione-regulated potassium-efflux system protein KefB